MGIIIYLIPIALFLGLVGLGAFLWSLKSGQYEDLDGASYRALFEEDDMAAEREETTSPSASSPSSQRDASQD